MKKFSSILMLSFALAGTAWAQSTPTQRSTEKTAPTGTLTATARNLAMGETRATTPADGIVDGIYEIKNRGGNGESDSRGYVVYAPKYEPNSHKNYLQIAGCKLSGYTGTDCTFQRTDDGVYEADIYGYWYLYTSANDNRYIFNLNYDDNEVKFLNKQDISAVVTPEAHSITIEQSTLKSAYKQIKFDGEEVYLSNSVGWRKSGYPMRWLSNTNDDAAPHSFETPTVTQTLPEGLLEAAKQKIQEYEATAINAQKEEVRNWADGFKNKVGYPTEAVYNTLYSELEAAHTFTEIDAAKEKFSVSPDINMPVSGKAYRIKAHFTDGSEQRLYWDGSAIKNGTEATLNADIFICRQVGTEYLFTNNYGKYLIWFDSGDANKSLHTNGVTDTYTATHNHWTLGRATVERQGGSIVGGTTDETFFGLFQMQAPDKGGNNKYYLAARKDGAFIAGGHLDKWYDGSGTGARSFVFHFEEVPYPNTPNLQPIEGDAIHIQGATHIATFSAPFATELPEGVSAYYVKADGVTEGMARVTAVEGKTVPANQGVILTSQNGGEHTLLPATETAPEWQDNQLGHSAGADKEMKDETGNFYVLTKVNGKVGFFIGDKTNNTVLKMNKSYLKGLGNSQAIRLVLDNTVTGVEESLKEETSQLPVYDLSGRRAMQPLKKGIYIRGGKKFTVR